MGGAAAYAFEHFPGWPVVARPVEVFQNFGLAMLRPRSVLLMLAGPGEWPDAQELARTALERGCTVVGLTNAPESPLGKLANIVFHVPVEGDSESPAATVCMHAALNLLAFEAMRALKKPQPWWEQAEKDLAQLPERLDWVFTQLPSVVRSMAAEVARLSRLRIVGGGFFHYPAVPAAWHMRSLASLQVEAVEATEFLNAHAHFARRDDVLLFLSGSH